MDIVIGKIIYELRTQKNLSQLALAKALNITQRKVSYWETGKIEPDIKSLWELADFFEVSVDYLIGRSEF